MSELLKNYLGSRRSILITLATILCLSGLYAWWQYLESHPSTENAYVNANAIPIAAQVSGPVQNLAIKNNQTVKKNDLLFNIDPKLYIAAIEEASAEISQREAQLKNAEINLERIKKLVDQKYLPPEEKDNAITNLDVAIANLQLADAKLDIAKLNLEYTHVKAPTSGRINNLSLRPGANVSAQMPLFVLISDQEYWVDANFKETELTRIRANQAAEIVVDMYPDHPFQGFVESISGSSGAAFSLLPPQNATGNWVKVTQRIPVKVIIENPDPKYPLKVGATATVTIFTQKNAYQKP